jgi:hypothetical protein
VALNPRKAKIFRPPSFEGCEYNWTVKEIKHLASGDVQITQLVPFEYRDEAVKLADAPGIVIQSSCTRVKEPYENA